MRKLSGILLAALCCGLIAGCSGGDPFSEAKRVDLDSDFGTNAFHKAGAFAALGPKNAMTDGAEKAADWIAEKLKAAGLSPKTDQFNDPDSDGNSRIFRNVYATLPGADKTTVLVISHYDTKSGISDSFVGANDSASSTALLLQLAEWYRLQPRKATVIFAFLDGEECVSQYNGEDGLHGSRHLATLMRGGSVKLDAVILADMIGDAGLKLTVPANSTPRLVDVLVKAAEMQSVSDIVSFFPGDILDDHQPFLHRGFPAIDLIDFCYGSEPGANDYWHTDQDTVDKLSPVSLQKMGALITQMIELISAAKPQTSRQCESRPRLP